ncbi:MAG: hypothetical protein P8J55_09055 [Pseudomonadales bacterium]|nr:hypothetical protein [Pseudomonadales bacterium]
MNEASEKAGIAAVHAFIETFNAQDHKRHAGSLNYPHIRLANGRFARIENAAEFVEMSKRGAPRLVEEGWHHTVIASLDVVHSGKDKVHFALCNDRCHADGSVYHSFDTLWIATLIDGHWGIQFRSSFLHAESKLMKS